MRHYFKFGPVVKEMLFKDFFYFNQPFVQMSRTICTILVEGIMGNIHVKLF